MIFVIGGRGRLGQALVSNYPAGNVCAPERAVYESWTQEGAVDQITRYFQEAARKPSAVFVASGLLDPASSPQDLLAVNYLLPRNIIEAATRLGFRVVTFGTVMEGFLKHSNNPYVQSKAALGNYVAGLDVSTTPVTHMRIHTLYGLGAPSSFMFLGQILDAIGKEVPFEMTLGRQLREYHHLHDEIAAIRKVFDAGTYGALDLSHGHPVSLRAIAEYVFAALGRSHLLRIGALPDPPDENYGHVFARPDALDGVAFRDSLPAILEYLRSQLPVSASACGPGRFNGHQ